MSKYIFLPLSLVAAFLLASLFGGTAQAISTSNWGNNVSNPIVSGCDEGGAVYFSAHYKNLNFNTSTGVVTYQIEVWYGRCNGIDTRAYAIVGDSVTCPFVGRYGGSGDTYDCVKYIGNPQFSDGSSLGCPEGSNADCVVSGLFWAGVGVSENNPHSPQGAF